MGIFTKNKSQKLEAVPHSWSEMVLPHESDDGLAMEVVDDKPVVLVNITPEESQPTTKAGTRKQTFEHNPENDAGILSRWTFAFQYPIFKLAKQKAKRGEELEPEDIFPLRDQDTTRTLTAKFEPLWDKATKRGHQGARLLMYSLGGMISKEVFWCIFLMLVRSAVRFFYPVLINLFLEYLTSDVQDSTEEWEGYLYSFLLAINTTMATLLEAQVMHLMMRSGIQTRSVLSTAVFRKTLVLSQASRASITTGEIINYMQLDTSRIDLFVRSCPTIVSNTVEILLFTGLAVYFIGYAALAGLTVMLISIPLNKVVITKLYTIDAKVVECTDDRVKITNETVQGMLGVKSAAWEEKFQQNIGDRRKKEVGNLRKLRIYDSLIEMMVGAIPNFTAAVAIATYSLAVGGPVSAPILFATIISFDRIRIPLIQVPDVINQSLQAFTSSKRLSAFLALPEVNSKDLNPVNEGELDPEVHVEVRDGTFYWSPEFTNDVQEDESANERNQNKRLNKKRSKQAQDADKVDDATWMPVLTDINVKFKTGQITSVVGPVGCGKTALTQVLLGELYRQRGHVTIRGNSKIAYCAQDPWILNATIADNITFGEPMDSERLKNVLQVCQLEQDLKTFPAGLATMIGEKGINLSGGQKARLSIARAAYSTAPVIVMDNPLSALDPGVAGKLFDECISKFMSGRTRILVTNQLHVLERCDWIVVLEAKTRNESRDAGSKLEENKKIPTTGRIQEQGTYASLRSDGLKFATLLEEFHKAGQHEQREESSTQHVAETNADNELIDMTPEMRKERSSRAGSNDDDDDFNGQMIAGEKLMTDEERAHGAVNFKTYLKYFSACGGWPAVLCVLFFIVSSRAAGFMSLKWVSFWTTSARTNYTSIDPLPSSILDADDIGTSAVPLLIFSLGYLGFTVLDLIFTFGTNYALMTFTLNGAVRIHNRLLKSVFGSPMSFFDTTPIGRIMNRFSKDLSTVDQQMPGLLHFFSLSLSFTLTSLIVLVGTLPLFAIAVVPFSLIYYVVLRLFRPVNRDVKRLESISRSPLYANFSETIGGTSTIRAYQSVDRFLEESKDLVDKVTQLMAMRYIGIWLTVRLELLGTFGVALIGILAIQGSRQGWLEAGDVGLSFQYVDTMASMIQFTLFAYANLEGGMTSVERVFYYSDQLEQERPREPNGSSNGTLIATPKEWPSQGEIQVTNLRMRYRKDTPLVLKGVTFSVKGGERIGICGRTGSGKSSLMKSLLRLVEPELDHDNDDRGPIQLDGIDISKIGLGPLRRAISVVSQDPTIFSGHIRMNLDPFDEYSDADIWIALEKCGLKTFVQEAPGKLQMQVSEFGTNVSQGQRQLLVLARCLLEKSKVLLLDESTASLDFETDAKIQDAIRSTFSECTVLVIAHRIRTILDSDKILVMDDGKVAEYDTPARLLADHSSQFYNMAKGQAANTQ